MIIKYLFLSLLFNTIFYIHGCSAYQADEDDIFIDSAKIAAWYNLMPGSTPSLHVSGELELKGNIDGLSLQKIIIIQQKERFEFSKPVKLEAVQNNNGKPELYSFSESMNLKNVPDLNTEEEIEIVFEFKIGNDIFKKTVEGIRLEKAY